MTDLPFNDDLRLLPDMKSSSYFKVDAKIKETLSLEKADVYSSLEDVIMTIYGETSGYKDIPTIYMDVPQSICNGTVTNIVPIKQQEESSFYRGILNGSRPICIRRIDSLSLSNIDLMKASVSKWKNLRHTNILSIIDDVYTSLGEFTKRIGDLTDAPYSGSFIVLYEYLPNSKSLKDILIEANGPLPPTYIWSIGIQLILLIEYCHDRHLYLEVLNDLSNIYINSVTAKVVVVGVGVSECFRQYESIINRSKKIETSDELKQKDYYDLGILLAKCIIGQFDDIMNISSISTLMESVLDLPNHQDLFNLVLHLIQNGTSNNLLGIYGQNALSNYCSNLLRIQEGLYSQLRVECDNSRLLTILLKLNFVASSMSVMHGDVYLCYLLRDFIFVQRDTSTGSIFVDVGFVIDCLNKIDLGSETETILLCDQESSMVMSWGMAKRVVTRGFQLLVSNSA